MRSSGACESETRRYLFKALLGQALSDDLRGVELLARSVDASYSYEGYDAFRVENLSRGETGRRDCGI